MILRILSLDQIKLVDVTSIRHENNVPIQLITIIKDINTNTKTTVLIENALKRKIKIRRIPYVGI